MHRISLAAAIAALTLATTAGAQAYVGQNDSTWTWSRQLAAGSTVTLRNINGSIEVKQGTGQRLEVRATKIMRDGRDDLHDLAFDVRDGGGDVRICTVYRGRSACDDRGWSGNVRSGVRYVVSLPADAELHASTGNGDVSAERVGGEVRLSTGNGRVRIGTATGRVQASTGNGDVEVRDAGGPVRVTTGNGDVTVATSTGPVSASTGNGDIEVRMKSARTNDEMSFQTGSGAIRLTLPGDFAGELDAFTGNGSLMSDFELQLHGRIDPQRVRATIGAGGGATLKLRTGNGRLELKKG